MYEGKGNVDLPNIDHFLLVDSNERGREALKNFTRPADCTKSIHSPICIIYKETKNFKHNHNH